MNYTTTWTLNVSDKVSSSLSIINEKGRKTAEVVGNSFIKVSEKLENTNKKVREFGDCLRQVRAIDWQSASNGTQRFLNLFTEVSQVGEDFEKALLDVSAITGVTGEELDKLGDKARGLAKDFGTTASDNLGLFQTILSRLGPQIG